MTRTPRKKAPARRRFKLKPLDPLKRAAVEKLLVRVYKQAAVELREMERVMAVQLRAQGAEVAARYSAARQEIREALRRSQKRL